MVSKSTAIGLVTAVLVGGCGASGSSDGGGGLFDTDAGASAPAPGLGSTEAGAATCGDRTCSASESCTSCALDCGECPRCGLAPTCSNALGIPTSTTSRSDLNQGVPADPGAGADAGAEGGVDAGPPSALPGADGCALPELRLRVAKVTVHKGGGPIYCIVASSDGASSEAAITMKTKDLGNEESHYFDPSTSMFWGQAALHPTENNITVTYNCYVVKSDAWAQALGAMAGAANAAGGIAGPYGWAFGVAGMGASAAAAAAQAASGDDLKFNAQQTLDKATLLDLTNGRTWTLRQGGGGLFDKWDWEIQVESWGCANGVTPAK